MGGQGKAYRLATELEHRIIRGTNIDGSITENPEVRRCVYAYCSQPTVFPAAVSFAR